MTASVCAGDKGVPSEAAPGDSSGEEAEADASRPTGSRSSRRKRRSDASSGAQLGSDPAEPASLTGALATSQEPPGGAPPHALYHACADTKIVLNNVLACGGTFLGLREVVAFWLVSGTFCGGKACWQLMHTRSCLNVPQ